MNAPDTYNLHLVSDSSGETVTNIARACLVQYENIQVTEHFWWLVRTAGQMTRVIEGIKNTPGLVVFTLLDKGARDQLELACREMRVPYVSAIDPVMQAFSRFFERQATSEVGKQHVLDDDYFHRIDAMQFTVQHDDGQSMQTMGDADMILVGVSRTSKTPTCMYLANRGFKVGNIPLVPGITLSPEITAAVKPLFVGLTREPKSLSDIRQSRLRIMNEERATGYADLDVIREEIADARRLFVKHNWPVIDVTRRSIEETAATIIQLYNQRHNTIAS
jgi:regulator of PEP synthase PpsR (kinase-PPPase family)